MLRQDSEEDRDLQFYGTELSFGDMNQSNGDLNDGFDRGDETMGYFVDEGMDESIWLDEKVLYRVKTAPARPLTDIEEFRKSKSFQTMERAVFSSAQLIHTYNNKYDIDSIDGQMACKTFLNILEKLQDVSPSLFEDPTKNDFLTSSVSPPTRPRASTGTCSARPTASCTRITR